MRGPLVPADRRGFGLLLVVVFLALLGVLSLTTFGIARREFRMAVDLGFAAQALESAEAGLAAAEAAAPIAAGAPIMVAQSGPNAVTSRTGYRTSITRLNGSLYLLRSGGERLDPDGNTLARRTLGVVGKLESPPDSSPPRFVRLESWGWVELYD